jgi:hypothetical protein
MDLEDLDLFFWICNGINFRPRMGYFFNNG